MGSRKRRYRRLLVPDTLEWSGRRPKGAPRHYGPVPFKAPSGLEIKMPCFDKRGRLIGTSTCTGLETCVMPWADDAWEYLRVAEAAADTYLRPGWRIARVDFARDMVLMGSKVFLREVVARVAATSLQVHVWRSDLRLGVTFLGVAGGDRLRIYHKGLEAKHKRGTSHSELDDVIRVELQLRKGQLHEDLREDVQALRRRRVAPDPDPARPPTMRTRPARGHGARWAHRRARRERRRPRRVIEATQAVDGFLVEQGLQLLVPGPAGEGVPDPRRGKDW